MTLQSSFQEAVLDPVNEVRSATVRSAGTLTYGELEYSIPYALVGEVGSERPVVLVSGGVHGEEQAGVHAAVQFLRERADAYTDRFSFLILPCVNPSGFDANSSENGAGVNVNRSFGADLGSVEAKLVDELLRKLRLRYRFTMDLHEIDPSWSDEGFRPEENPRSCYLYETAASDVPRIGRHIIDSLPEGTEVCDWLEVYGDLCDGGVVSYPTGNLNSIYAQRTTFDAHLFERYTSHSFTTETPIGWPMKKRVATQLSFLEAALDLVSAE